MGSTTPVYAFPYPVGTDLITDGDNAIEALARRVEAVMAAAPSSDAGWTVLPLLVGWVAYGAPFQGPRYRRVAGIVYVQGIIKSGTAAGSTVIANLPVGYRPAGRIRFATGTGSGAAGATGLGTMDVLNNGDVMLDLANANYFALHAIFPADA